MSSLRIEKIILTIPAGDDVGIKPNILSIHQGNFDIVIVNGIDVTVFIDEAAAHIAATSGVHGVTGNVVGTTDTQTLTNKTIIDTIIISPQITSTTVSQSFTFNTIDITSPAVIIMPDPGVIGAAVVLTEGAGQTISQVIVFQSNPVITNIYPGDITKTLILPVTNDTLVGKSTVDIFINKTIDTSVNIITITSGPLTAININSILNQAVLITSTPTFVTVNLTNVVQDITAINVMFVNNSNTVVYRPFYDDGAYNSRWTTIGGFMSAPTAITTMMYSGLGRIITCSFVFDVVGVAAGANTAHISLPVGRIPAFSSLADAAGTVVLNPEPDLVIGQSCIQAVIGSGSLVAILVSAQSAGNVTVIGSFQYRLY